jgi:hypothetical protein
MAVRVELMNERKGQNQEHNSALKALEMTPGLIVSKKYGRSDGEMATEVCVCGRTKTVRLRWCEG